MKELTKKYSFAVLVLLFLPILVLGQTDIGPIKSNADSLYDVYKEQQALDAYMKILERAPNNYKALWRSSFLYSRIGNRFDDEEKQEQYFNKGISLAKQALQVDSTDAQSNFVMAVAKGRKALISGARKRVAASREIKKYADRALSIDKKHAGAWHVLGRWHFKVANLSWIERAAANTLFGGIPDDASNEKAARAIEKAIALNDDYILYHYDLAKVYEEMGKEQKAVSICRKALDKPLLTPDDESFKEGCKELIDDIM